MSRVYPQELAAKLFVKYSDPLTDNYVTAKKAIRAAATFMLVLKEYEDDLMLGDYESIIEDLKEAR